MSTGSPSLVPELLVADATRSVTFWCELCGFAVDYAREDEGFAYISRGGAHLMLEQQGIGRNWITAPLDRPLGRGVNFQITVLDLGPILSSLREAGYPLFMEPETKWYRAGSNEEAGVEQFLVTDPDGYLVRFQTSLGRRSPKRALQFQAVALAYRTRSAVDAGVLIVERPGDQWRTDRRNDVPTTDAVLPGGGPNDHATWVHASSATRIASDRFRPSLSARAMTAASSSSVRRTGITRAAAAPRGARPQRARS